MSQRATTRVWESSKMKGGSLLVLLAIADYANDVGRNAFPSTHTLAWKSRLTFRQVRQILTTLQEANELLVEHHEDGRRLLHIRCVFDEWPALPKPPKEWNSHPAKKSEPRKKSPRGLTPSGSGHGEDFRGHGSQLPIPRQPTAGDPLSDPLSEQEHAAPTSPPLLKPVEPAEINHGLLMMFTHEVLDAARYELDGDIEHDVAALCIKRRVPWHLAAVRRAVESVLAARRRLGATP